MSMESHGGMLLTGKTDELGVKPVPVQHCPPPIPHGLIRVRTRASSLQMLHAFRDCLCLLQVLSSHPFCFDNRKNINWVINIMTIVGTRTDI
jgi:hypothetical protein